MKPRGGPQARRYGLWPEYIKGHHLRDPRLTGDYRKRQSASMRGRNLGDANPSRRPDVRAKISKAHKGRPRTERQRTAVAAANRVRVWSEAERERRRVAMTGSTLPEQWRQALADGLRQAYKKGVRWGMSGRKHTAETREKIRRAHLGKAKTDAHVAAILKASFVRPNRAEMALGEMLDTLFPGQYRYVGNGDLVIGGRNPDFVNVNGQKKLIELYGDYWHQGHDPAVRAAHFAPFGYTTLVVWERELAQSGALATKLVEFHEAAHV